MSNQSSNSQTGNVVRLHRVLQAPPNIVYRAFLEPAALCKWLPPYGITFNARSLGRA